MSRRYTSKYCNDRAGHWETKSKQAAARGNYNKSGEYRTKALQWAAHGKRAEERRSGGESRMNECECGGKVKETGDIKVLGDGYEIPIYKCEDCSKEI